MVSDHCSRIRRQMRGLQAMLWPPGHSSLEKIDGTVLDGQPHAMVACEGDDVRPDLEGVLPVGILCLAGVATHERVHEANAHLLGRLYDQLQVADDLFPVGRIGMQRVGIEAQARRCPGRCPGRVAHDVLRLRRGQVGDVDMGSTGIASGRSGGARPACESRDSRSRCAALHLATSASVVSGNGAVSSAELHGPEHPPRRSSAPRVPSGGRRRR